MEALIYSIGVMAILSVLALILFVSVVSIQILITRHIARILRSLYLHVQLFHFMSKLKKDGISSLKSDAEKFGYKAMSKDFSEYE